MQFVKKRDNGLFTNGPNHPPLAFPKLLAGNGIDEYLIETGFEQLLCNRIDARRDTEYQRFAFFHEQGKRANRNLRIARFNLLGKRQW